MNRYSDQPRYIDAEGTNMQDSIRLTSCEEIVEPSVEQPPV